VSGSFLNSLLQTVVRASWIAIIYASIFGVVAPLLFMRNLPSSFDRAMRVFVAVWLAPGLLFFTFGFLRLLNSGFLLVLAPPLLAVLGAQAAAWYREAHAAPRGRLAAAAGFLVFNSLIFLFVPLYFGYFNVRETTNRGWQFQAALRRIARPESTVILAFDDLIDGFRIAGYFLPEYLTLEVSDSMLSARGGIVAMRNRRTELLPSVDPDRYKKFVFYPPYPELGRKPNFEIARTWFPEGALQSVKHGDFEFVVGDLRFLSSGSAQRNGE
jgi:hypothetical protein